MSVPANKIPASPSLSKADKLAQSRLLLRAQIWPDLDPSLLWSRKKAKGFATVPRPLPLMLVILDQFSKGKPPSSVYLDLWCRMFDEGFVRLDRPHEMALSSGFLTPRGPYLWAERLDILDRLGFIRLAPGPQGSRSFALVLNPYRVLHRLFSEGKVQPRLFNALASQADLIGAEDLLLIATQKGADIST